MRPSPFLRLLISRAILLMVVAGSVTAASSDSAAQRARASVGICATYCGVPRLANRRADVKRLIAELIESHVSTYSFCIHAEVTDWEDLQLVLPAAKAAGIHVWASILPPSESLPRGKHFSEPFRMDYVRWAEEFGKLSLRYPNLVAWSIDDFTRNLKETFTPAYVKQMYDAARRINPSLAFVPCCYYPGLSAAFAADYGPFLDGVLFPYRAESVKANLEDVSRVETEVTQIRSTLGPKIPIVLDIYATAHSRLGATTPEYVDEVMLAAHRAADGVMIYCHQDPTTEPVKYSIVKRNFTAWANEAPKESKRVR